MKTKLNSFVLGISLGIIAPIIAVVVFYFVSNQNMNFSDFIDHLLRYKLVSHMISIGAISNLIVFFGFIWINYLKSARGVVFATMLYALLVVITKFI
jgi:hypothetical protein